MNANAYQDASVAAEERLILDLVRYGLDGEPNSIRHLARKLLRRSGAARSEGFRKELGKLLLGAAASPLRGADRALPVEPETRLPLASIESGPRDDPPILRPEAEAAIDQLIEGRLNAATLINAGVEPPRTVLLTGPPGVGKSMTARYLATCLDLPLITVELGALMSSFLGKTGQNLRQLLDHGQEVACVLFLDEFDAVGKRRDDLTEIGELKRLVNLLLLELDRWPASGLLVAATNHPQLLDPAVERRFDLIADLALPGFTERQAILTRALGRLRIDEQPSAQAIAACALAFEGESGAGLERIVSQAAREAILDPGSGSLAAALGQMAIGPLRIEGADKERRAAFAGLSNELLGMSQREIAELLGVSHPTVGKLIAAWRESMSGEDATESKARRG
jgi:hypothetical protein